MIGCISRRHFVSAGLGFSLIHLLPRHASAGPAEFRTLTAKSGSANLLGKDGPRTEIWGYDGTVPGPVLRARRGDEIRIRLLNQLTQPTSIHWHGIRIENSMDGAAGLTQKPAEPGKTFDYRFTLPDAGTYWYHPHMLSSEQVDRGLHGLLIVDEAEPVEVDRDIALVLDDWRLEKDGRIHESFGNFHDAAHQGRYGNYLTVNGQATSEIPVRKNERIRLRLLNAANARIMPVRIAEHEATVMALDGQPTTPFPAENSRVVLSPGSRCDLFIDAKLKSGASAPIMIDTGREEVEIARLIYVAEPKRVAPLPPARPLPSNALPERMDLVNAFRLEVLMEGGAMSMKMRDLMTQSRPQGTHGHAPRFIAWTLNGKASEGHDPDPLFSVKRGQTVVLSFPNETRFPHNIHIHGHHFRHLDDRDDSWKPYWLDTVLILPGKTERIAFIADNPGKWMIHCHMLEHQAAGMAAWFKVG